MGIVLPIAFMFIFNSIVYANACCAINTMLHTSHLLPASYCIHVPPRYLHLRLCNAAVGHRHVHLLFVNCSSIMILSYCLFPISLCIKLDCKSQILTLFFCWRKMSWYYCLFSLKLRLLRIVVFV